MDRAWFNRVRVVAVVLAAALALAACSSGRAASGSSGSGVEVHEIRPSPVEQVPSALADPHRASFPRPLIDPDAIMPGGPGPDGIPPVDRPRFATAGSVRWLHDREPVLAFDLDGEARAYPVQILLWHEIVNDTVGGMPVAITYCPLCNSALAFDRRAAGRVLDFGTSGKLYNSDLVMYDRQTQSLWPQLLGTAAVGVLTGTQLVAYPVATVSWREWRSAHPDGLVLTRNTGFIRHYGRNPYPGYDDVNSSPFLFNGTVDGRLVAKQRVIGLRRGNDALAVSVYRVGRDGVFETVLDGSSVILWVVPGTASALDAPTVDAGRDVGATGVFDPALDGRRLTFRREGPGFRDDQTGSTFDVFGRAISGPLAGRALQPVVHVDTFWFAWAAFEPTTRVIT